MSAAFSPDGRRVVTASRDKTARVWDTNTGKPVGAPLQHQAEVRSAAFSPNGHRVVTASRDKTARVWEVDTGKPVGTPLQHQDLVLLAAFSPDGHRVVTASRDKTARVWNVMLRCCSSEQDAKRLAALAEAVGGYELSDTGSLSFIGYEEQTRRLVELGRSIVRSTPKPDFLSLDWVIRRFTQPAAAQGRR